MMTTMTATMLPSTQMGRTAAAMIASATRNLHPPPKKQSADDKSNKEMGRMAQTTTTYVQGEGNDDVDDFGMRRANATTSKQQST
jgi:hypothetical protein